MIFRDKLLKTQGLAESFEKLLPVTKFQKTHLCNGH
jgi:hypothetical protein